MSAKSRYIPTTKAQGRYQACPQTLARIRKARNAKAKRTKKVIAKNRKR